MLRKASAKRGIEAALHQMPRDGGLDSSQIRAIAAGDLTGILNSASMYSPVSETQAHDDAPKLAVEELARDGVDSSTSSWARREAEETLVSAYMIQSLSPKQRLNMLTSMPSKAGRVGVLRRTSLSPSNDGGDSLPGLAEAQVFFPI